MMKTVKYTRETWNIYIYQMIHANVLCRNAQKMTLQNASNICVTCVTFFHKEWILSESRFYPHSNVCVTVVAKTWIQSLKNWRNTVRNATHTIITYSFRYRNAEWWIWDHKKKRTAFVARKSYDKIIGMDSLFVLPQVGGVIKSLIAKLTTVRTVAGVDAGVPSQVRSVGEGLAAKLTRVGTKAGMSPFVALQARRFPEAFVANFAHKQPRLDVKAFRRTSISGTAKVPLVGRNIFRRQQSLGIWLLTFQITLTANELAWMRWARQKIQPNFTRGFANVEGGWADL